MWLSGVAKITSLGQSVLRMRVDELPFLDVLSSLSEKVQYPCAFQYTIHLLCLNQLLSVLIASDFFT